MSLRVYDDPQEDHRLRKMILISAGLHVIVILWVVVSMSLSPSPQPRAVAYTVELVSPASLGTNLPGGGKKEVRIGAESAGSLKPLPQVAKKEEPKLSLPIPKKETGKIPETVKPKEKPLNKAEPKKGEPQAELPKVAKAEEPRPEAKKIEAKPEPNKENFKKVEEKKSEPQKVETKSQKTEVKSEPVEIKPEKAEPKPEAAKPAVKAVEKNSEEKLAAAADVVPAEERDRQIATALERIKAQVQPKGNPEFTEEAKGTGPVTKGGAPGEGGGGVARGIEFIMYTQQLQRQVQASWIVTEKRPGLAASVSFKIQPDGDIQEVELTQSSGDGVFDQSVVRAIRKAAPFPPPPRSYSEEFATQKIVMNFGGEGRIN